MLLDILVVSIWGCDGLSCHEQLSISLCVVIYFQFSRVSTKGEITECYCKCNYFPKWLYHFIIPPTIYETWSCTIFKSGYFPKWLYHFIIPPTIYETWSCTIFKPILDIVKLLSFILFQSFLSGISLWFYLYSHAE